ncbi:PDZ domain-containing protein GIPC3-like [Oppia nitens]|uniref:PDZ domain-containing protein GIPC3-like n=1 Tax=Oppia nitens TaxID=1686743 RepID=UPI0023DA4C3C|nr:PDZ domain-containing protein GIPC3-like [Oppia nitens]
MPIFGNRKPKSPELSINGGIMNENISKMSNNNNNLNYNSNNSNNNDNKHKNGDHSSMMTDNRKHPPKLVFQCQLAEGSHTTQVSNFSNIKQLYEKIGQSFNIAANEILYCTLNTHKVDMDRLLGGQIGLDDFIFIHRKGQRKEVEITKNEEYLGLTITDNGNGYSFIKKVKEGSAAHIIQFIKAGDHIEKIDNESMVGKRHFEVAKTLKDIPRGTTFILRLVEPFRNSFQSIGPRSDSRKSSPSMSYGSGKETLRIRKKGPPVVESMPTEVIRAALDRINQLLESFMGINDNDLANEIWELGQHKANPHDFVVAIDESDLREFSFTDDFIFDLWGAVSDAKDGRLAKI